MKICKVKGCNKIVKSKGFCGKHYMRNKRHGDPLYISDRYHGMVGLYEYDLWHNTKKKYSICSRWLIFKNFYSDIGKKPTYEHWLVRIDNNKPFGPDNFKWTLGKSK